MSLIKRGGRRVGTSGTPRARGRGEVERGRGTVGRGRGEVERGRSTVGRGGGEGGHVQELASADEQYIARTILKSYLHHAKENLLVAKEDEIVGALENFPDAILAHDGVGGGAAEAKFVYCNARGREMFEAASEDELIGMVSSRSADANTVTQEDRRNLLDLAKHGGIARNYAGVRVSVKGRRFEIKDATLWNLVDEDDEERLIGQAVHIPHYRYL